MNSRLLSFSLALNLILIGVAGFWFVKHRAFASAPANILQTNRPIEKGVEPAPAPSVAPTPAPLRWNELESADYPTYIVNLRRVGCPEPVLRRIISADLKELFARKAFAAAEEFHHDFWEIAARENIRDYFEKTLRQQVKALCGEPDDLLKQLLGDAPREASADSIAPAPDNRLTNFLSAEKQEQLREVTERYDALFQSVRKSNGSPQEKESQLSNLRLDLEKDLAGILSPDELAEYQLRQSSAAKEVQQLYGVDFNETELRNVAKVLDDFHREAESDADIDPETLDQKLASVLGPSRFADYNRARSATYREIYDVASEFGQPASTAAEIFDLRLASEKQCEEIRADKTRSFQEKQALLDSLQEQVEQSVLTRFGAAAFQKYKSKHGQWINSLGKL
jgi:hypothetical protein